MSNTTPTPSRTIDGEVRWQSKIYKAIVTPIHFVTFLLSLYLIDSHYRAQRYRQHASGANNQNERPWLHRLLYQQRSSPYDLVDDHQKPSSSQSTNATHRHEAKTRYAGGGPRSAKEASGPWFYRTKQRKLLKAEAAEAFALRNSVLLALCILAATTGWVLWRTVLWLSVCSQDWRAYWMASARSRHAGGFGLTN